MSPARRGAGWGVLPARLLVGGGAGVGRGTLQPRGGGTRVRPRGGRPPTNLPPAALPPAALYIVRSLLGVLLIQPSALWVLHVIARCVRFGWRPVGLAAVGPACGRPPGTNGTRLVCS
eukprot:TRINITY_DN1646_c0_g1_i16.p4 TRINITY_DN1646_c0_g1~~TRINITY_DN1646_c0_g1_i16.p4  ORF type:complete len:118 (-),score=8.22 TRINITY_DN1646_c0_g1_i16:532-885(-)